MTAIRRPGSGCHVTASPPDLRAVSSTPDGTTGSTPWRVAVPVSGLSSVPYTMTKTPLSGVNSTRGTAGADVPRSCSWAAAAAAGATLADRRPDCWNAM